MRMTHILTKNQNLAWADHFEKIFNHPSQSANKKLFQESNQAKSFLSAVHEIYSLVEVNQQYQIPYLAGYSERGPLWVYIDRDFNPWIKKADGTLVDVRPFIVLHEFIEKALIDFLKLEDFVYLYVYLRPHQLAQRFEKEAVTLSGISWTKYQHEKMAYEIARAENQKVFGAPDDIDWTPYRGFKDSHLISRMSKMAKKGISQTSVVSKDFTLGLIRPQVYLLKYKDQQTMASTLMRFQEHFESPHFRGKIFTREQFEEWSIKTKGKFTYIQDWDGFNFPDYVLKAFYLGKFKNLTAQEKEILETFQNRRHQEFYVIAVADNSEANATTLAHEIAHSLYYLNPQYKTEVTKAMKAYDLKPVKQVLFNKVGDYHKAVLTDEAHAWLMHNSKDLQEEGLKIEPYQPLIDELQKIYKKYTN